MRRCGPRGWVPECRWISGEIFPGQASGPKSQARAYDIITDMRASPAIPVEEYLRTAFRPDCDYVDGALIERNVGGKDRSKVQRELLVYLHPAPVRIRNLCDSGTAHSNFRQAVPCAGSLRGGRAGTAETALARDWLSPEEDAVWASL